MREWLMVLILVRNGLNVAVLALLPGFASWLCWLWLLHNLPRKPIELKTDWNQIGRMPSDLKLDDTSGGDLASTWVVKL